MSQKLNHLPEYLLNDQLFNKFDQTKKISIDETKNSKQEYHRVTESIHGPINPNKLKPTIQNEQNFNTITNQPSQSSISISSVNKAINRFEQVSSQTFSNNLNELVKKFNEKREKDQLIHMEFQECFSQWSNDFQSKVLDLMGIKYENYTKIVSEKIAEVYDDLNRIAKIEKELETISNQVEMLYNEIKLEKP